MRKIYKYNNIVSLLKTRQVTVIIIRNYLLDIFCTLEAVFKFNIFYKIENQQRA